MQDQEKLTIVFGVFADFWNGMATAWAFGCYDAITRGAFDDLLISFLLAILSLSISIGIKLHLAYDKLS
jgi:hypothetical protein